MKKEQNLFKTFLSHAERKFIFIKEFNLRCDWSNICNLVNILVWCQLKLIKLYLFLFLTIKANLN